MAEICVKAVLAVADIGRRDVNLDLIKVCLLRLHTNQYCILTSRASEPVIRYVWPFGEWH